ncbi:hypothetical protein [Myceligenerans crystallogenes]|uniref:Sigma-70, region 4 n=1 Tax=Myceligenerans crystallogenes TaxID=316335 RepID=A0ABN2NBW4_9MICO
MDVAEFEDVRADPDPIRQARNATALLQTYSQRSHELARLRRAAIDRAHDELGMTYTEVASQVGISKGRVTQLRKSAPPLERAFFGVGPVTIAFPVRAVKDRPLGVVAVEDETASKAMAGILESLSLAVETFPIPAGGEWEPPADAVAICGPKSSRITAEAIANDPHLSFEPDEHGRWVITDRSNGNVFVSPSDEGDPSRETAYIARVQRNGRMVLIVAGVHALGSVGAVEYIRRNLTELFEAVGEQPFSLIVTSSFEGMAVTETAAAWGPRKHTS